MTLISPESLAIIAPTIPKAKLADYADALNNAMQEAGIVDWRAQALFVAQVMHESGGLYYAREIASGKDYDPPSAKAKALGNTEIGDGPKFKGGGWMQLTGRFNYTLFTKEVGVKHGVDFVKNPEKITEPKYAALSATWYWNSRKLTPVAVAGTEDAFLKVTKIINGGTNGLDDRKSYWVRAKKVLDPAWILSQGNLKQL